MSSNIPNGIIDVGDAGKAALSFMDILMDNSSNISRITILSIGIIALVALVLPITSCSGSDKGNPGTSGGFSRAVDKVLPSLVEISNEKFAGHPAIPGIQSLAEIPATSEGTGFFIDKDGLILTNYHVVEGSESIKVTTHDKKIYEAEVVGSDALTDIAIVRIKASGNVTPVVMGDSSKLKVGQWVIAIGNPLGVQFFTSAGIVSGFGPPGPDYVGFFDFIQTDANIEPGNSGGPLINDSGEVVGISNAYMGPGTGIAFAIPINRAKEVVAKLTKDGKILRGFLGVTGQPLTTGLSERLGVKGTQGALINGVLEGSPAALAGLKEGDVVLRFNGQTVQDFRGLQEKIYSSAAGAATTLVLVRGGKEESVFVRLGELMAHTLISQRITRQCGITLQEMNKEVATRLGVHDAGGLLVLKVIPGCPSYEGGLRFGDVVRKVEGTEVNTVEEFYKAFTVRRPGSQVLLYVVRNGMPLYITIAQGEAR